MTQNSPNPANMMDRWKALAAFAAISGVLPYILLNMFSLSKFFVAGTALAIYFGLGGIVFLGYLIMLVLRMLWVAAAVGVWLRRPAGLLLMLILCGLRSAVYFMLFVIALRAGLSSVKPGGPLPPHDAQFIVLLLFLIAAAYSGAMLFTWRTYRTA